MADTNGSAPQAQAMCKAVWPAKHLPNKRWNMKYGEIWWSMVKYGEIWWNVDDLNKVP